MSQLFEDFKRDTRRALICPKNAILIKALPYDDCEINIFYKKNDNDPATLLAFMELLIKPNNPILYTAVYAEVTRNYSAHIDNFVAIYACLEVINLYQSYGGKFEMDEELKRSISAKLCCIHNAYGEVYFKYGQVIYPFSIAEEIDIIVEHQSIWSIYLAYITKDRGQNLLINILENPHGTYHGINYIKHMVSKINYLSFSDLRDYYDPHVKYTDGDKVMSVLVDLDSFGRLSISPQGASGIK